MAERGPGGIGALAFLLRRSLVNFTRSRLRRLRDPRHALALAAGLLYFGFWWGQAALIGRSTSAPARAGVPGGSTDVLAALLAAGAALAWLWPARRTPLRFSESEIHWLFGGPFARPVLVAYKVLSRLPSLCLTAFFLALTRGLFGGGSGLARDTAAGLLVFFTLDLHVKGAGLVRMWARERGLSERRFTLVAATAIALLAAATSGPGQGLLRRAVAWPFTALLVPLEGSSAASAWLPAVGLLVLHLAWVLAIPVSFEDSAIDLWLRLERTRSAPPGEPSTAPGARRPQPFRLAPRGRPEVALLWKNLIAAGRWFRLRNLLLLGAAIGAGGALLRLAPDSTRATGLAEGFSSLVLLGTALLLFLGPSLLRNDLRADLLRLEILKVWPLSGFGLVLGELFAPFLVLLALAALALAALLALGRESTLVLLLAALTPGWLGLSLLIHNAAAVLFPAWVVQGRESGRGLDAMGQGLLLSLLRGLVLLIAGIPAGVLGVGVLVAGRALGVARPLLWSAALAGLVLLVEAALGLWLVGRRVETLEPLEQTGPML